MNVGLLIIALMTCFAVGVFLGYLYQVKKKIDEV